MSSEKKDTATFAQHHEVDHNATSTEKLADNVQYGKAGILGVLSSPYVLGAAFLASTGGFSWVRFYLHQDSPDLTLLV